MWERECFRSEIHSAVDGVMRCSPRVWQQGQKYVVCPASHRRVTVIVAPQRYSRLLRRDRKRGGDHRRGRYASVAGGRRDREVTPGDEFGNGGLCAGAQGPVLLGDGADHAALEAKEERVLLRLRQQLGKLDLLNLD